jgi:hypothetical protein
MKSLERQQLEQRILDVANGFMLGFMFVLALIMTHDTSKTEQPATPKANISKTAK